MDTTDADARWLVHWVKCPGCKRIIVQLGCSSPDGFKFEYVRPRGTQRPQPPPEVTKPYRDDYLEGCAVLPSSPKASAALSRRCLQSILRDKGGFDQKDLADQIQAALDGGKLPSHITESLDAVRHIGNFAAHPIKSKATGEIVEVEAGESEWNLDTIEALFDYYFVQPALTKKKRDLLNEKLKAAGKPLLK